ncbi:hypothetical protein IT400_03390 [Candidatus Nomurabacteria bacterium]|nr:hypothetical protein [Candidatus Nomurabacteria bacterium]
MISLENFKKSLGEKLLKELSEEQILKLREQQDKEAEICFAMWLKDIKSKEEIL